MRHTLSFLCPGCNRYGAFDMDDPKAGALSHTCNFCGYELHGELDLKTGVLKEKEKTNAGDDGRAVSRSKRKSR